MADPKLFHVTLTLDIDLVVLAENEEEAVAVGKDKWLEEVRNSGLEPGNVGAREVTKVKQLTCLGLFLDYPPFGVEGRVYEEGSYSPQLTIAEYMESMGIK